MDQIIRGCGFGDRIVDDSIGQVSAFFTLFTGPGCPETGISGSAALIGAKFTVDANNVGSAIDIDETATLLVDSLAMPIFYLADDGFFSNRSAPPPILPRWVSKSPIPTAREGYGAAAVDRIIYYIAGYHNGDTTTNEAYDTATNTWSLKAPLPDDPRSETVAVTDGIYVYLMGGRPLSLVGNDLWRYDPRSNSWTSLRSMPTARATEHVAVYHNGRAYVIGGRTFDAPGGGAISSVEIYDVASDAWTSASPLPEPRSDFGAVVFNNRIYVIGGLDQSGAVRNTVFIYDIATNTWASGSPMPQGRASYAAGVCGSQIYTIAGIDPGFSLQTSNYAYDPGSDSWTVSVPIPNPTAEAQGVSLPEGIYVVSGEIFGSGSLNPANYFLNV